MAVTIILNLPSKAVLNIVFLGDHFVYGKCNLTYICINTKEYAWLIVSHHNIRCRMTHFMSQEFNEWQLLNYFELLPSIKSAFPKIWMPVSESPMPPSLHLINVSVTKWWRTLEVAAKVWTPTLPYISPVTLRSYLTCLFFSFGICKMGKKLIGLQWSLKWVNTQKALGPVPGIQEMLDTITNYCISNKKKLMAFSKISLLGKNNLP